MQQRGGKIFGRTPSGVLAVFRPLFLVAFSILPAVPSVVFAEPLIKHRESALDDFGQFDERLVEQWKEIGVAPPTYPNDADLIAVRMPTTYTLKIYLDEKSVSLAQDGIARFTLVIESASGSRNVFFEGYQCETSEYKTYASGTLDKTFEPIKKPKWERAPYYDTNAFRFQLLRYYVCDPNALSVALPPREFIHRLRSEMNQ